LSLDVFKTKSIMIKKRKILVFVKFIVVLIVVSVLAWMFLGGGCLNLERVKLLHNNIKIGIIGLCALIWLAMEGLCAMQVFFESKYIVINKRSTLLSVQLLI
jgi:hypothetical protein